MAFAAQLPIGDEVLATVPEPGHDRVILIDSAGVLLGMKTYECGEVFGNHFHEGYDEFFAVLDGTLTVWTGRAVRHTLTAGTSLLCARGTQHYLANAGPGTVRMLYAKVPPVADDTVWVDWSPGTEPT